MQGVVAVLLDDDKKLSYRRDSARCVKRPLIVTRCANRCGIMMMMMMMKLPILPCAEKLELVLSTAPKT